MLEPLAPDALEFTWALPGETTWLGFSPFAQALVLALVIKATPGPVFTETLRRGVIGGFGPAFAVQFGSLLGTALWVVSVGLVGGLLAQGRFLQILLGLTGTGLLAIFGWQSVQRARHRTVATSRDAGKGALACGAALSVCNPWAVAAGAVGLLADSNGAGSWLPAGMSATFAGFFTGALLWCFGAPACIALLRWRLTPGIFLIVDAVCGCLLLCAAGMRGWKTVLLFA